MLFKQETLREDCVNLINILSILLSILHYLYHSLEDLAPMSKRDTVNTNWSATNSLKTPRRTFLVLYQLSSLAMLLQPCTHRHRCCMSSHHLGSCYRAQLEVHKHSIQPPALKQGRWNRPCNKNFRNWPGYVRFCC